MFVIIFWLGVVENVFKIGSVESGAMLYEAMKEFEVSVLILPWMGNKRLFETGQQNCSLNLNLISVQMHPLPVFLILVHLKYSYCGLLLSP